MGGGGGAPIVGRGRFTSGGKRSVSGARYAGYKSFVIRAILLIVDRLFFIAPVIAGIYFGVLAGGWLVLSGFFLAIVGLVIYTTPHRYGLCVALDYLTRVHWGDSTDALPSVPGTSESDRAA